jgi:polysaccharide export outer membrane protein
MAPVRVARAFRLPIIAALTVLALSGCMRRTAPVAVAPQPTLDSMAYGGPALRLPPPGAPLPPPVVAAVPVAAPVAVPVAAPVAVPVAAPVAYAAPAPTPAPYDAPYHLDAGDKLRVVVYGQEGLSNTYAISAGGTITMPLIGSVPARGRTPAGLASEITARLRNGFIREPSVAVEVEAYRPFFILGEVQAPGQYPYVPNMTVESAVAIAGGFSPRARRDSVTLTHTDARGTARVVVPPGTPISPGDTVLVGERWF